MKECKLCQNIEIERGDTLYKSSSWDGGVGYDYIDNVQYCPLCGRKLLTLEEWMAKKKKEKKNEIDKPTQQSVTDGVIYHLSCPNCDSMWWDDKPLPKNCPKCGAELMK